MKGILKVMRVLQISKYYYPFLGGTEQVARDIATAIKKIDGIEQKVICFNEDANDESNTCRKQETKHDYIDDVEVIRCGCQAKVASQSLSLSYAKELGQLMNEFKPDVVILHYPNPFVTHFLLKYKKRNFKLWVYWHLDITKQKLLKKLFQSQNVELIKRADLILGATPKHLNESEFSPLFEGKKQFLPYTIDEASLVISREEIQRANEIRAEHADKKIGFFIGRHVPYKGLKHLIEASKILGDEKIHFYVAGTGELTNELMEKAKGDSKVEFLGRITDSDRRAYLYACDVICFPSITRNEAFGLALAEGMYFGKPAVTFTIPGSGVNYVNLDRVTGIECPNSDSKAYADALKELIDNDSLRMEYGSNARKRIIENFTVETFGANIENLLKNV